MSQTEYTPKPLTHDDIKLVQKIIQALLFYSLEVYNMLLVALITLVAWQAKVTKDTILQTLYSME